MSDFSEPTTAQKSLEINDLEASEQPSVALKLLIAAMDMDSALSATTETRAGRRLVRKDRLASPGLPGIAALVLLAVCTAACGHRQPAPPPSAEPVAALLPPGPPEIGPTYQIGMGDELDVKFLYQPEQSVHVPVRPDGRISLPVSGELDVVGLTPMELQDLIVKRSSARLRNPEVTVVVTKLGEQRVYIGGEVRTPGFVTLRPGMTPLQAVLQSGGFKKTAKLDSVLLLTPGSSGQFSAARIDMQQVVEDGVPERVRLHANAVVYVPPTWVSDADDVVDQYVRGLFPALPRVGAGYSLSQ
jgi:polysaccharide export outer membrane protein